MEKFIRRTLGRRKRPEPKFTFEQFLTDPKLLGLHFPLPEWATWLAIGKAAKGERLTEDELAAFCQVTGRIEPPSGPVDELWAAAGRGSGKSKFNTAMAVYQAVAYDWPVMVTAEHARQVMEVYMAADLSAARNEPVSLPMSTSEIEVASPV